MRNAIVGIKPTVGLTSRGGVVPESSHQDSVGPFGKTVKDATLVLDVSFNSGNTVSFKFHSSKRFFTRLFTVSMRGITILLPRSEKRLMADTRNSLLIRMR